MFDLEVELHRALLVSKYRTHDPALADWFFVPVYANKYACAQAANGTTPSSYSADAYREALALAWSRRPANLPRRHLIAATHGWAYEVLPAPILDDAHGAVVLVSHGNVAAGYHPSRFVVVPPVLTAHAHGSPARRSTATSGAPERRPLLAAFKGVVREYWHHSFGVRQLWAELFRASPRVHFEAERDGPFEAAERARFCLCPPGFYAWSPRPVESLFYGCVPAIVADDLVLPFAAVLDWDRFAVRVPEDAAADIEHRLVAVDRTPGRWADLHATGCSARAWLALGPGPAIDLLDALMLSLYVQTRG